MKEKALKSDLQIMPSRYTTKNNQICIPLKLLLYILPKIEVICHDIEILTTRLHNNPPTLHSYAPSVVLSLIYTWKCRQI